MKAAIYSRKSKFTGKGESIENQIQLCMDHAKNLGIEDFLVYEDEGFSGKSIDRPQFKEMLKDAKDKKFDYLICYRLDRISRNVSDFSTLIEDLNKLDISFISIKEQFDTSTPMGRAMMYISSVFAQLERETIAERVRDNMYELARSGRWLGGNPPLGFISEQITYYDENMTQRKMHKLTPCKKNMDTVKLLFEKYLELGSLTQLFKYCNSNNITGIRGGKLDPGSLSLILKSPAYVKADVNVVKHLQKIGMDVVGIPDCVHGVLTYAKNTSTPIAAIGKHEGIIESKRWLEVQRLIDANKDKAPRAGTGNKAVLSGLLKCSKCGSNMRISYRSSNFGSIHYYVCGTKKVLGTSTCDCRNVRADKIEKIIIEKIRTENIESIINSYSNLKNLNNKDIDTINKQVKTIKGNIEEKEKIVDTLIMQLGRITDSSASTLIIEKIENINKEILKLKLELENLQNESNDIDNDSLSIDLLIDSINRFNNEIEGSTLEQQRLLLSTIIDSIIWDGENETATINYLGVKKK